MQCIFDTESLWIVGKTHFWDLEKLCNTSKLYLLYFYIVRGDIYLLFRALTTSFFLNFLTLQYCIGFAIYQYESATGIHMFPTLNLPPSSLPVPSLWVVPVHQPQASSIVH